LQIRTLRASVQFILSTLLPRLDQRDSFAKLQGYVAIVTAFAAQDAHSSTSLSTEAVNRAYLRSGGGQRSPRTTWRRLTRRAATTAVILRAQCVSASHKSLLTITDTR